jgi:hypothetical protein
VAEADATFILLRRTPGTPQARRLTIVTLPLAIHPCLLPESSTPQEFSAAFLALLLPDRWVAAHPEHRLEQREEESREAQTRRRRKRAARRLAIAQ